MIISEIIPSPYSINEEYNKNVFLAGFEQTRDYGKYKLVAKAGYLPYIPGKPSLVSNQFRVEAWLGKHQVAWVNFEVIDDHLEAIDLVVEPKHRRRGIATAMYRFAHSLGNSIKPSSKQTGMGRQFWATKSPIDDHN